MLRRFLREESGATAIEYSLIGMLVSLAIIGGATLIGHDLGTIFNSLKAELK